MPEFLLLRKGIQAIVIAGLLAGTLDITAALLNFMIATGRNPTRVLLYIASGVFGSESFSGGIGMAMMGLLFHYCIAFAWSIFFFLAYPKLRLLSRNKLLTGLAYGCFIWVVMNLVVLPLSNVPPVRFDMLRALVGIVILMFCVGLPIAVMIGRYYAQKKISAAPARTDSAVPPDRR